MKQEVVDPRPEPKLKRKNPYVGPRALRSGEALFARDRETRELGNLLVAERIVLLHSPSGAGKTSLIRAGLNPFLKSRRFRPTKPLRVNTEPPPTQVHNRYIYSAALGIFAEDGHVDPEELAGLDFRGVIELAEPENEDGFLLLVFDQFEEILTINPSDWTNQAVFFKELGSALVEQPVWALFSMREDYIGGLDRFLRYLPGHLATTYRLDFLDRSAAKEAIQRPARDNGVEFADDAADELVRRLACIRIQSPGGTFRDVDAPYVQPVQLQVVCRKLWKSAAKRKGPDFSAIDLEDVETHADIATALKSYYAGVVAEVAVETGAREAAIRDWVEAELITAQGFRSQTVSGPVSGHVDPTVVLHDLEEQYLIRSDPRPNGTWWELTHDMLIEPIIDDNNERRDPWQIAARKWGNDRVHNHLLRGAELSDAQRRASRIEPSQVERDFLDASAHAEKKRAGMVLLRRALSFIGAIAIAELLVIVVLALLLYMHW